ncbi:hypothetical protein HDU96_007377 [Phlyctochytrium bullatum]|nr:hypothetical protein HDU96_007377 [Phlyctochytrium bullatum]
MQLEPYQDPVDREVPQSDSAEDNESGTADFIRPNVLNYENYRRQNDLKTIEQLSKSYDRNLNKTSDTLSDPDAEFFKNLEEHLKKFVMAVTDLKRMRDMHLKDQYITATSMVHSRVDIILEEIKSFDLFDELSETLETISLTVEEVDAIEATGVVIEVDLFPAPMKPLLREAQEQVRLAARRITEMGKLASGVWPPPNAEREMLEACYPCVLAVKKLFSLTKEAANKIRRVWAEDAKKKEEWNRRRLQNEKVKALFQVWQGQEEAQVAYGNEELTPAELGRLRLEETYEGVSMESNGKTIRGGRLAKMEDFGMNELLLRNLRDFTERVIIADWELLGNDLLELMDFKVKQLEIPQVKDRRKSNTPSQSDEMQTIFSKLSLPKPIIPKAFQSTPYEFYGHLLADRSHVFDVDPLELARQLTLIEFEDFKKVKPYECLAQIWASKLNKEREAARIKGGLKAGVKVHVDGSDPDSNIMKMIKHTNLLVR